MGDEVADKVAKEKDAFNCQSCLEMESPKVIEDNTDERMSSITSEIEKLFAPQPNSSVQPIEEVNRSNTSPNIEEEAHVETLSEHSDEVESVKETSEPVPSNKNSIDEKNPKPCCIWSKCKKCDVLEQEKEDAIGMNTAYNSCIATLKKKLKTCEDEFVECQKKMSELDEEVRGNA